MRLIFIRHAEPDYEKHTLTEKGFREANILSERVTKWDIDAAFVSPLERAVLTAKPSLDKLNIRPTIVPWLQEFSYPITDPTTGKPHVPWDFMPEFWTKEPLLFDHENFYQADILQSNPAYEPAVMALRKGLDDILAGYGYHRKGSYYATEDEKVLDDDEKTIVFFGHLGANSEAMGYLLGISPLVLQQSVFLAPTAVSILNFEKRLPGQAMARAQVIGDTRHLFEAGEPISNHGAFSRVRDM